jgi:hypothetical protein
VQRAHAEEDRGEMIHDEGARRERVTIRIGLTVNVRTGNNVRKTRKRGLHENAPG